MIDTAPTKPNQRSAKSASIAVVAGLPRSGGDGVIVGGAGLKGLLRKCVVYCPSIPHIDQE
jgi:hypothetical protein